MRVFWERRTRLPRFPAWSAGLVGGWLLLVLGGVLLERRGAPPLETCLLHRLTGHPCPTCGSTRVVLGLLHGRWFEAFLLNPMVWLGLVAGCCWLGLRMITRGELRVDLTPFERGVLWFLALGAFLLNWGWVLHHQP